MGTRRHLTGLVAVLALAVLPQHGAAQKDKTPTVTRRIATLAPEGSLWMKQLVRGAAKVEELTQGRVKTKYYGGGSQGDERAVVRKMRLKQLDGAALTSVGLGLIYSGIRVLELPFLFDSVEELDYVRARMWPYFQEKFTERGFELLAPGDLGWVYLFSNNAVTNRDELQKMRIWAWQDDPLVRLMFRNLGMDGVPLSVPEVLPSLNSGRIDAAYASPLAAVAMQWHTRIRYMSSEPLGYGIGGMVIRTSVWNAPSARDQRVQMAVGRKLLEKGITRVRGDNVRALTALIKNGMVVIDTPPEVKKDLLVQAKKVRTGMVGKLYTQEELDMALAYREEFRKSGKASSRRGFDLKQ